MQIIIVLLTLCFYCTGITAQTSRAYTPTEDRAINAVGALPEVKRLFRIYADSPQHIEVLLSETPDVIGSKYYRIKVGQRFSEDGGNYFLAHYDFYVTPKDYRVKHVDIITLKPESLKKWRAEMNKRKQ